MTVELTGFFAHYQFERWTELPFAPSSDSAGRVRMRFDSLAEAHSFLRGLLAHSSTQTVALHPLLFDLDAGFLGHGSALTRLANMLIRRHIVVHRIERVPIASDEPNLSVIPLVVHEQPEPLELDGPRAEARLEFERPLRVRAKLEPKVVRVTANLTPKPRRVTAKLMPAPRRTTATLLPEPRRITATLVPEPRRVTASLVPEPRRITASLVPKSPTGETD